MFNFSDEKKELILGAFLHDIGKIRQRAELPLGTHSKNMIDQLCIYRNGKHSHYHVLHTNEFFENEAKKIPDGLSKSNIANLACNHHKPGNEPLQNIINIADRLSAGMDRRTPEETNVSRKKDDYKRKRLLSVFEKICINKQKIRNEYKYEMVPLKLSKVFFPKKLNDDEKLTKEYKILYNELLSEINSNDFKNFNLFLYKLMFALEKYSWCVPSSTIDLPDISLFDHSKTTSAISTCLYDYHKKNNSLTLNEINNFDEEKFILIVGDLSGIQKFIFNLSNENSAGVTKILRARSFYIDTLIKACKCKILSELELPEICTIIDSGGRFIILAPNIPEYYKKLEDLYYKINEWLKKETLGELVIKLNWEIKLKPNDFFENRFNDVIDEIQYVIEKEKRKKMYGNLTNTNKWDVSEFIFSEEYSLYEKNKGSCVVCGSHPKDKEDRCRQCDLMIELGGKLTHSNVIAISENKGFLNFFDEFYVFLFKDDKSINESEYFNIFNFPKSELDTKYPAYFTVNQLPKFTKNDLNKLKDIFQNKQDNINELNSYRSGNTKTFEYIAANATEKNKKGDYVGKQFLGILKGDVDNLGLIFNTGLKRKKTEESLMTISRYASISRMLNLFFTGYTNTLISEKYPNVYSVYSGGDDFLFVSDWKTVIDFAIELYNNFKEFTCYNPDITFSAGISLGKHKYPLRKAAENSEQLLKSSKQKDKDRITLFETTKKWDELPKFREFYKFLDEGINKDENESKIKTSFVFRLLRYHQMALSALEEGNIEDFKFHSQMAYDIARNILIKDEKGNIKNKEEIKELQKLFDLEKFNESLMKGLKIPVFWALYKNRGGE